MQEPDFDFQKGYAIEARLLQYEMAFDPSLYTKRESFVVLRKIVKRRPAKRGGRCPSRVVLRSLCRMSGGLSDFSAMLIDAQAEVHLL